jgi:hypothetical protein
MRRSVVHGETGNKGPRGLGLRDYGATGLRDTLTEGL